MKILYRLPLKILWLLFLRPVPGSRRRWRWRVVWGARAAAVVMFILTLIFFSHYSLGNIGDVSRAFKYLARHEWREWTRRPWPFSGPKTDINQLVREAAQRHKVDEALIHAVIMAESEYHQYSISRTGACGLMQLMPGTFEGEYRQLCGKLGKKFEDGNPFDPQDNIQTGTSFLAFCLRRFKSVELAAEAYNAGPGAVARYNGIPPYAETKAYVRRVVAYYQKRLLAEQAKQ
ncbi:MAG: transglycosylase SLT domain-containing protein [Candidatus Sumerlaeota bacterium]|nr:transglycosylase SLT domain-containing protein [Candidatus Sumerlaeota bacterium]